MIAENSLASLFSKAIGRCEVEDMMDSSMTAFIASHLIQVDVPVSLLSLKKYDMKKEHRNDTGHSRARR
ncbi:UNVERIFIED_CONTAM: hypothetical protein K2H54_069095 [Gekko kuhli]